MKLLTYERYERLVLGAWHHTTFACLGKRKRLEPAQSRSQELSQVTQKGSAQEHWQLRNDSAYRLISTVATLHVTASGPQAVRQRLAILSTQYSVLSTQYSVIITSLLEKKVKFLAELSHCQWWRPFLESLPSQFFFSTHLYTTKFNESLHFFCTCSPAEISCIDLMSSSDWSALYILLGNPTANYRFYFYYFPSNLKTL